MAEDAGNLSHLVLLVGVVVLVVIFVRAGLRRVGIPALVGYILVGIGLGFFRGEPSLFSEATDSVFLFLAKIGVITLLFRIGLESNIRALIKQLKRASAIWTGNVLLSFLTAFAATYYILNFSFISGLFVAVALTATSVGITVAAWREENKLDSPMGELLLDVAEMDDLSGAALMAIILSLAPFLRHAQDGVAIGAVLESGGVVLLKLFGFGGLCLLFSLFVERHLTNLCKKMTSSSTLIIPIAGIGFIIAAIAGLMGFPLAIGAFFAGLAFSRDPESVRMDTAFTTLYDFFSPFFFVGIGLSLNASAITAAGSIGGILLAAAILGKLLGDGLPAWASIGKWGALLIGVSMIPRAEIALIIMQKGVSLGNWAVSPELFAGMVFVTLATCIISPIAVRFLLARKGVPDI